MSGLKSVFKIKAKKALKLTNNLRSYLFEQECSELSNYTPAQKEALRNALLILGSIVNKSK